MKVETVDEYIAESAPEVQERLRSLRALILELAPSGADERMSWNMPSYYLGTSPFVHFAAHKHHIGLYPGVAAMEHFAKELAGYKTSKGSIQLPNDKDLPLDLVRSIVQFNLDKRA